MTDSLFSEDLIPPALHVTHAGIWMAFANGDVQSIDRPTALALLQKTPLIILNAPMVASRLKIEEVSGLDLLELFAFVHPAHFAVPTAAGLTRYLHLSIPEDDLSAARILHQITKKLLNTLSDPTWAERGGAWDSAAALARRQWSWSPFLEAYLEKPTHPEAWLFSRLPEWEETPPRSPTRPVILSPDEAADSLENTLGEKAEARPEQRRYARHVSQIFNPRENEENPHFLLAQAGTGIGKTLGYLAPAVEWAEKAEGTVWISTYTKALQRQLGREAERIFPDFQQYRDKVAIRKGRENYLCLLNLEEALQSHYKYRTNILVQLVARWAAYSRDGDMVGGDLPGWLISLFRRNGALSLTDRRGECIYSACTHFRRCFIERAIRATKNARIVIANHALVMLLATGDKGEENNLNRLIFDEGHHVFESADATFASAFTAREACELRRWLTGSGNRRRRKGLSEIAGYDAKIAEAVEDLKAAASFLPSDNWLKNLAEEKPQNGIERLFLAIRHTIKSRADKSEQGYSLEIEIIDIDQAVCDAAKESQNAIQALLEPIILIGKLLERVLVESPDWLNNTSRGKIEGLMNALQRREMMLSNWLVLIGRLTGASEAGFIDWLAIDRIEGREYDVGIHRHWIDPTYPLAEEVYKSSHGLLITSATLGVGHPASVKQEAEEKDEDGLSWEIAEQRSGARHLNTPLLHFEAKSPFRYSDAAEVFIVTDIQKNNIAALSNGYVRLLEAAKGGALGLFSSIHRLKRVHAMIVDHLARQGLPLYAQHVDPMDTGTLVDIFRDDPHASLLGTDALRDGIDVPGQSLRLVIMEGLPWPRPTVAHAARRRAWGGRGYDDQIIRAKLAQGFGRLIRSQHDKGAFVLLSSAVPSRLLNAFPENVTIHRLPLDETTAMIAAKCRLE